MNDWAYSGLFTNSRCFPEKNFTEIENYFENEISNETDSDENETDEIGIEGEQEDKDRYSGILKRIIIFISNLLVAGK